MRDYKEELEARRRHELYLESERKKAKQQLEDDRQRHEWQIQEANEKAARELEEDRYFNEKELLDKQAELHKRAERAANALCMDSEGEKILGSYSGDLNNGVPQGQGTLLYDDGDTYEGEFLGGKFHGKGISTRNDGTIRYDGEWRNGKFHGFGIYYYSNSDAQNRAHYRGHFCNGMRVGKGLLIWKDGITYEGDFVNNEMHGVGEMKWPRGDRYVGQFAAGKREGNGTYTSSDGFCYEGDWKAGNRHGKGILTYPNGWSTTAEWMNDKPYKGLCRTYAGGTLEYEGEYANGKREGYGILYHKNGDKIYEGSWLNGAYSGLGTLRFYQNDELCYVAEGVFERGKLRKGTYKDGEYLAKGYFDENGHFFSGELYRNDALLLKGDISAGKFDTYVDQKVFHIKPIFGLVTYIGADDEGTAYIWVKINALAHNSHGGNDFNNILIKKCGILGNFVSDGRPNEWLYAKDGSGYLKLDPKTNKGELHFKSNQPSYLMQKYGMPFKDDVHFILTGRFENCRPTGECILKDKSKDANFSEYVTYVKGTRQGEFKWVFKHDNERTVTGSYHNGIMSPIGEISYTRFGTRVIKKYKGEINQCGLPNGLGKMFWDEIEGESFNWDVVEKCKCGFWENGECIKELSSLAYLFYKIKK